MVKGGPNGITTMVATASLVLSALVFWTSISNRTSDRIDGLENKIGAVDGKVATVDGATKGNTQRLDKDEAWIATLITARMK